MKQLEDHYVLIIFTLKIQSVDKMLFPNTIRNTAHFNNSCKANFMLAFTT